MRKMRRLYNSDYTQKKGFHMNENEAPALTGEETAALTAYALKRYLSLFIGHGLDDDFSYFDWFPACVIEDAGGKTYYDSERNEAHICERDFVRDTAGDTLAALRFLYARESFGAVHAYVSPMTFSEDTAEAGAVRETLSEYFAYLFCLIEELADPYGVPIGPSRRAAEERRLRWKESSDYNGAEKIAERGEGDIDFFCEVLKTGRHDMKKAFGMLSE